MLAYWPGRNAWDRGAHRGCRKSRLNRSYGCRMSVRISPKIRSVRAAGKGQKTRQEDVWCQSKVVAGAALGSIDRHMQMLSC